MPRATCGPGQAGRQSLLLLNASDWGGHHHYDSLNLYYWKENRELLSDLGYLWDHPDKRHTYRTFAHNLVMIDGREQVRRGRGGSYHLFSVMPRVKVMEASSQAYGPDGLYRRTCVEVDHGPAGDYVLDVFRAGGGKTRDYVFHGPAGNCQTDGLTLAAIRADSPPGPELPLTNLRIADGASPWRVSWSLDNYNFHAFAPGNAEEQVMVGDGWGQRDHRNTDRDVTLPYIVRRRQGQTACDAFVTVFVGGPQDKPLVEAVRLLPLEPGGSTGAVAVQVTTSEGVDLIVSSPDQKQVTVIRNTGRLTTDGHFAAILAENGKPARAVLLEGTRLDYGRMHLELPGARLEGKIVDRGTQPGRSYFAIDCSLPSSESLVGQTLFAIDGPTRRAYPIRAVERSEGSTRVYTKDKGCGFEARAADRWELPLSCGRRTSP